MQNDRADFPLSIALLIAAAVIGAYFYLLSFGHDPSVLLALSSVIESSAKFWTMALVAFAINVGLIGSWIRRTIGLKKQGSRLQKLDGKSRALIHKGDRYSIAAMAVTFLSVKGVCREPLIGIYTALGVVRSVWLEVSLVGNFVLLSGCIWLLIVRIAPRFQTAKVSELTKPNYQPMTLVLGTTPMEVLRE